LCFVCNTQGHRAADCPKKTNRPRTTRPFKKKEDKKTMATQAFAHIKKLVADMEQDQFEELAEQMNELELPIDNQDPF
jgi:hypothetical protein